MEVSTNLWLDKPFFNHDLGTSLTVVATVQFHCPGAMVCRTTINKQEFITDANLDRSANLVTLMDFNLVNINGRFWLLTNNNSKILQHQPVSKTSMEQLVEGCSGIGAVGQGFQFLGLRTVAFAESNEKFASWLVSKGHQNVIVGDISHNDVIHKIGQCCRDGPPTVTAGVSCQPFSYLGDRKERFDPRSESMPSAIRLGFLLNSPLIILECTPAAMKSDWVQDLLKEFQQCTSYSVDQIVLDLHHLWPSHRTRWWAILSHPMLRLQPIPKMPSIGWSPSVMHLFSEFLHLSGLELAQLELTPYELRLFHANAKGTAASIVNMAKTMPTATHSWGSQLLPCSCGCRKGGFTMERIEQKGLYGILIPLGKEITLDRVELSCMRHPHPEEIALLNGLNPQYIRNLKSKELRLLLAGVGQLGSPLQSIWVMGNILRQMSQKGFLQEEMPDPIHSIRNFCKDLLHARDERWKDSKHTKYMDIFQQAINQLGTGQEFGTPKEHLDSLTQAMLDKVKQVEIETPSQPDAAETPQMNKPLAEELQNITEKHHWEYQPDPHVLDRCCVKGGTPVGEKTEQHQEASVYATNGGISCFSTKRKHEDAAANNIADLSNKQNKQDTSHCKEEPTQKNEEQITPTVAWTQPVTEDDTKIEEDTRTQSGHIWFGHEDQPLFKVAYKGEPTVGQATQAEVKLQGMSQHQRSMNPFGSCLSITKAVADEEVILIRPIGTFQNNKCKRTHLQAAFCENSPAPDLSHLNRLDALWHQMGWVAKDEMTFHLGTIKEQYNIKTAIPIILDSPTEQHLIWGKWIVQGTQIAAASNHSYEVNTVCWHDHHWFPVKLEVLENTINLTTTPVDSDFVHQLSKQAFGNYEFLIQTFDIKHLFPVDCGYQSLAWILAINQMTSEPNWLDEDQALLWKQGFSQHLIDNDLADQPCRDLCLGGMHPNLVTSELQKLLEQHGVKQQRSAAHAQHIISKLSLAEVIKTLQAPRPWQDLKAKANAQTPTIQLVHSDELKQMIDNRLKSGKSMGQKQNKENIQRKPPTNFQLNANQIQVPAGIFQQADGTKIHQLKSTQMQQNAQGFAIVNACDARPFFELQEPISKSGLALIILDHQHPEIQGKCESIRFPAHYADTDEPVIVTAGLLQLGQQAVLRHKPDTCTKIDETKTSVLRILVYRDLYQEHEWQAFHPRPVKCLMELEPMSQLPSHYRCLEQTIFEQELQEMQTCRIRHVFGNNPY